MRRNLMRRSAAVSALTKSSKPFEAQGLRLLDGMEENWRPPKRDAPAATRLRGCIDRGNLLRFPYRPSEVYISAESPDSAATLLIRALHQRHLSRLHQQTFTSNLERWAGQ